MSEHYSAEQQIAELNQTLQTRGVFYLRVAY
jgi:hypothetical protein